MNRIVGVAVMLFSSSPRVLATWYADALGIETSLYEAGSFCHGEIVNRDTAA